MLAAVVLFALALDPARSYPLYSAGVVQQNGGPWLAPGTFAPSHRATVFNRSTIVVRLSLTGDPSVPWMIRALPQIDVIDLVDPRGNRVLQSAGMRIPFAQRVVPNVDPTLEIPPQFLDGRPLLVRIVTSTEVREPRLITAAAIRREDDGTRAVVFWFIGFYCAVGLVFALLYFSLPERQLILYAAVMLSLVIFEAINKSLAWQYLWPNTSLEWHVPNALSFWIYYAALVLFCSNYLEHHGRLVIFRIVAWILLLLNLGGMLAGALAHDIPGLLFVEQALSTAMLAVLLVWAGFAWRSGQRSARFYVVAFAGVFLGVLINRFALDQVLPHTGFTEWILEIGVAWEVMWLAVAVADHINETVRENAMLHASEMQLQHLATMDGLTTVPNRRAFDTRLESEWNRAKRTSRSLALLLVDIDHFKQYNDTYGHLAGDDCLRRVARSIAAAASRSSDFVARYGGEEFAVLLPEADLEEASAIAERTRIAVLELAIPHERSAERCVTISVGVAAWAPSPAQAPSALVAAADSALYDSKRSGRNAITKAQPVYGAP